MKNLILAATLAVALPASAQEASHPTKLFASSADVQALVAKAKAEHKTGNTVELVVNDEGYPFQLEYRTETTPPSIHRGQGEGVGSHYDVQPTIDIFGATLTRSRFVKGAGFLVRGLAQVSMNLTDFEQTPVHRVFEVVRREAERYGVVPVSSEIVGLIPKKALESAAECFEIDPALLGVAAPVSKSEPSSSKLPIR